MDLMIKRALNQKDAKVNKSLDFIIDKFKLRPLYPGHKPLSVMIDSRSKWLFDKIKANKDKSTLLVDIYETLPVLER